MARQRQLVATLILALAAACMLATGCGLASSGRAPSDTELTREEGLDALRKVQGLSEVLLQFESADPAEWQKATRYIRSLREEVASMYEPLLKLAEGSDPDQAAKARRALSLNGKSQVLLNSLDPDDYGTWIRVRGEARKLCEEAFHAYLAFLLSRFQLDEPKPIRWARMELVAIGEEALPAVLQALEYETLRKIKWEEPVSNRKAMAEMARVVVELGEPLYQAPLAEVWNCEEWQLRYAFAVALRHARERKSAVEQLAGRLQEDPEWQVRAVATESLGELGGMEAATAIGLALRDREPLVRNRALDTIRHLNDAGAVKPLIALFSRHRRDDRLRNVIHRALQRITGAYHVAESPESWRQWLYKR